MDNGLSYKELYVKPPLAWQGALRPGESRPLAVWARQTANSALCASGSAGLTDAPSFLTGSASPTDAPSSLADSGSRRPRSRVGRPAMPAAV